MKAKCNKLNKGPNDVTFVGCFKIQSPQSIHWKYFANQK